MSDRNVYLDLGTKISVPIGWDYKQILGAVEKSSELVQS